MKNSYYPHITPDPSNDIANNSDTTHDNTLNTNLTQQNENDIYLGNRDFSKSKFPLSTPHNPLGVIVTMFFFIAIQVITCIQFYGTITNGLHLALILISSFILFLFNSYLIIYLSLSDPGFFVPSDKINTSYDNEQLIAQSKTSTVNLKICKSCNIIRNLRVFHCKHCGLCVLRHDHHCIWLSNCIGVYNHQKFLVLVFSSLFQCVFFILCILYSVIIYYQQIGIIAFILSMCDLGVISICFICFMVLLVYQIIFILTNQTTSENIKRNKLQRNQFDTGSLCENIKEFFCYPLKYKERFLYNSYCEELINQTKMIKDNLDMFIKKEQKEIELTVQKEKYLFL